MNLLEHPIHWDVYDVVLSGRSAIDLPSAYTATREQAHNFILNYGYDLGSEPQFREVVALRSQAIRFIEQYLLPDPDGRQPDLALPEPVRAVEDARDLMVMAATGPDPDQAAWACAILRVMHTITHVENDLSLNYFPEIQRQIVSRISRFIYTDPDGFAYLGRDGSGIPLSTYDIKSQKGYSSSILKLLQKPDNTAADIFDRIGVRFVTFSRLAAVLALKYLVDNNVFAFPNVKPERTRNTFFNFEWFRGEVDRLLADHTAGRLTHDELHERLDRLTGKRRFRGHRDRPDEPPGWNIHSSTRYNSIQFTCRQLVRVKAPVQFPLRRPGDRDLEIEYKFFFPYEIQILDKDAYLESRKGRASHAEYKRSQLRTVRRRLFGRLAG